MAMSPTLKQVGIRLHLRNTHNPRFATLSIAKRRKGSYDARNGWGMGKAQGGRGGKFSMWKYQEHELPHQ